MVCEHGYRYECGCNCDQDWVTDVNAPYRPFPNCNIRMWDPDDSIGYAYTLTQKQNQYVPAGAPPSPPAFAFAFAPECPSVSLCFMEWVTSPSMPHGVRSPFPIDATEHPSGS